MYCNRGSLAAEETVLQYSLVSSRFVLQYKLYCEPGVGLCRNTARARQLGAVGRAGGALAHGARAASARQERDRGPVGAARKRGARALGMAWACRWPTGCALGALGLFLARFDSVLFLSQILDIVREPGS